MMLLHSILPVLLLLSSHKYTTHVDAFQSPKPALASVSASTSTSTLVAVPRASYLTLQNQKADADENQSSSSSSSSSSTSNVTRRNMMDKAAKTLLAVPLLYGAGVGVGAGVVQPEPANAMVGSLPEFADANAVLQGITVDVADLTQQNSMIEFLREGLQFKLLRQRKVGSVTETWMGYGPEEYKIPSNFELPVSSFNLYGGHGSICIRYDSQSINLYYRQGDDNPPGTNIAYVQVGVPEYRISQMVKTGGNVLDAYGIVNVISPSGLPFRGIIGIRPDPLMFVALNCVNLKESREFYEQLGFFEQEYPYARPNKGMGQFEPLQPKNSIYMAPSVNSMGVLLLQSKKKRGTKPNPVFRSMNIVYTPSEGTVVEEKDVMKVMDPIGTSIKFQPYELFEREELSTRIVVPGGDDDA